MTHFDLCGCVLFPGSSNVQAEFADRHAWQGCPSSHLILRRLFDQELVGNRVTKALEAALTDIGHTPCTNRYKYRCGHRKLVTNLLSLKRLSLRIEA